MAYSILLIAVVPTIATPMDGEQFNITEGRNGSITCTATGYPEPAVVWQFINGSSLLSNIRLVSGSAVNISSTGVGNVTSVSVELMVIGAMRVDTGMYRCSANNSVNSTTRNINITVQCKYSSICSLYCGICIDCMTYIRSYVYKVVQGINYQHINSLIQKQAVAVKSTTTLSM